MPGHPLGTLGTPFEKALVLPVTRWNFTLVSIEWPLGSSYAVDGVAELRQAGGGDARQHEQLEQGDDDKLEADPAAIVAGRNAVLLPLGGNALQEGKPCRNTKSERVRSGCLAPNWINVWANIG